MNSEPALFTPNERLSLAAISASNPASSDEGESSAPQIMMNMLNSDDPNASLNRSIQFGVQVPTEMAKILEIERDSTTNRQDKNNFASSLGCSPFSSAAGGT